MDSDQFDKLFNRAIDEREKGDIFEAVRLFRLLFEEARNIDQKLRILNHLGLAHFHAAKSYEISDPSKYSEYMQFCSASFKQVLNTAQSYTDGCDRFEEEAVALRNLGRPELATHVINGLAGCAVNALQALVLAKQCKRKDLVWFTHGLITARVALAKSRNGEFITRENKKLVRQEAWQWFWLTGGEPKLNKQVWFLGLLKDIATIHPKLVTYKRLMKMWYYAKKNGLERRAEQIQKVILELYPPQPA